MDNVTPRPSLELRDVPPQTMPKPSPKAAPPSAIAAARPGGSRGGSAPCSMMAKSWWADKDADGKPILRAVRPGDITLLFRALTNV